MWTVGRRIHKDIEVLMFSAFSVRYLLVIREAYSRSLHLHVWGLKNSRIPCLASKHSKGESFSSFETCTTSLGKKCPALIGHPPFFRLSHPPSLLTKSLVSGNCFVRPDKKGEVRPKTSLIFRTRRRRSRARLNILLWLSLSLPSFLYALW